MRSPVANITCLATPLGFIFGNYRPLFTSSMWRGRSVSEGRIAVDEKSEPYKVHGCSSCGRLQGGLLLNCSHGVWVPSAHIHRFLLLRRLSQYTNASPCPTTPACFASRFICIDWGRSYRVIVQQPTLAFCPVLLDAQPVGVKRPR